jgi:hypothetical protein
MGLWFFEETAPFAFSLADELTEVQAALIRAGALDDDVPDAPCAEVVDLRAVRLARLGDGGPDA